MERTGARVEQGEENLQPPQAQLGAKDENDARTTPRSRFYQLLDGLALIAPFVKVGGLGRRLVVRTGQAGSTTRRPRMQTMEKRGPRSVGEGRQKA